MTLELGHIELRAGEVVLRPLVDGDAPALAVAAAESRESYHWIRVPDGEDEARAYVARALADSSSGRRYPFAVEWRGRLAGTTSYIEYQPWQWPADSQLQRHDRPDALEIGHTFLAASAQRTACNTQAKLLLLQHAFESFQVHRVSLQTDARNARSRAAIERLGARLDGVLRGHKPAADGSVRHSAWYSILADEWSAVRERLLRSLR
jgi:RimJ/RimL family protein N-acetyltransferase